MTTTRNTIYCEDFTWVATDDGQWSEWQFSPYYNACHFVGIVGGDRIQYAVQRLVDGQNPNC